MCSTKYDNVFFLQFNMPDILCSLFLIVAGVSLSTSLYHQFFWEKFTVVVTIISSQLAPYRLTETQLFQSQGVTSLWTTVLALDPLTY